MPSTSNRKPSTTENDVRQVTDDAAPTADTAAVSAPVAATPTLPPAAPHTAATRAVWAALVAQPASTVVMLADAAGISRPTVAKALTALEAVSLATRTPGGREGSKRLPDQWQAAVPLEAGASPDAVTEPDEPVALEHAIRADEEPDGEPEPNARESTDAAEQPVAVAPAPKPARARRPAKETKPAEAATDAGKARLGSGQLRDMVLRLLRDHPDEDFSPSAMGKRLDRSSGAISNACDRLQANGAVVRTSDKPRKFRIAAAQS